MNRWLAIGKSTSQGDAGLRSRETEGECGGHEDLEGEPSPWETRARHRWKRRWVATDSSAEKSPEVSCSTRAALTAASGNGRCGRRHMRGCSGRRVQNEPVRRSAHSTWLVTARSASADRRSTTCGHRLFDSEPLGARSVASAAEQSRTPCQTSSEAWRAASARASARRDARHLQRLRLAAALGTLGGFGRRRCRDHDPVASAAGTDRARLRSSGSGRGGCVAMARGQRPQ
jgi:hypothetical protein